jgi:putative PIN family toxin of toxin-antitoxin system
VKLVLDTNIVVSAALGNVGDGALIAAIEAGQHDAFASAEMLGEYRGALARLVPEKAEAWMALLARILVPTEGAPGIVFPPDPTDAKFIACALAAGAAIVTRDKRLTKGVQRAFALVALAPEKIA